MIYGVSLLLRKQKGENLVQSLGYTGRCMVAMIHEKKNIIAYLEVVGKAYKDYAWLELSLVHLEIIQSIL